MVDHERRVEVGEERLRSLGQPGVHRDREHAAAQQRDHQLDVRHGPGDEQGDPVAGREVVGVHGPILSAGHSCAETGTGASVNLTLHP